MPRRGEERNAREQGDEVVADEIYPDLRAIEDEPHPKVDKKDS